MGSIRASHPVLMEGILPLQCCKGLSKYYENISGSFREWAVKLNSTKTTCFLNQENNSKTEEELQNAEDKVAHLNMVKNKLEQTLDDLDDSLERERRSKGEVIFLT